MLTAKEMVGIAASAGQEEWLSYTCPHCLSILEIDGEWSGQAVSCPSCGSGVQLPRRGDLGLRERRCSWCGLRTAFMGYRVNGLFVCPNCRASVEQAVEGAGGAKGGGGDPVVTTAVVPGPRPKPSKQATQHISLPLHPPTAGGRAGAAAPRRSGASGGLPAAPIERRPATDVKAIASAPRSDDNRGAAPVPSVAPGPAVVVPFFPSAPPLQPSAPAIGGTGAPRVEVRSAAPVSEAQRHLAAGGAKPAGKESPPVPPRTTPAPGGGIAAPKAADAPQGFPWMTAGAKPAQAGAPPPVVVKCDGPREVIAVPPSPVIAAVGAPVPVSKKRTDVIPALVSMPAGGEAPGRIAPGSVSGAAVVPAQSVAPVPAVVPPAAVPSGGATSRPPTERIRIKLRPVAAPAPQSPPRPMASTIAGAGPPPIVQSMVAPEAESESVREEAAPSDSAGTESVSSGGSELPVGEAETAAGEVASGGSSASPAEGEPSWLEAFMPRAKPGLVSFAVGPADAGGEVPASGAMPGAPSPSAELRPLPVEEVEPPTPVETEAVAAVEVPQVPSSPVAEAEPTTPVEAIEAAPPSPGLRRPMPLLSAPVFPPPVPRETSQPAVAGPSGVPTALSLSERAMRLTGTLVGGSRHDERRGPLGVLRDWVEDHMAMLLVMGLLLALGGTIYALWRSAEGRVLSQAGFQSPADFETYQRALALVKEGQARQGLEAIRLPATRPTADLALRVFYLELRAALGEAPMTAAEAGEFLKAPPGGAQNLARTLAWEAAWHHPDVDQRLRAAGILAKLGPGHKLSLAERQLRAVLGLSAEAMLGPRPAGLDGHLWEERYVRWHYLRAASGDNDARVQLIRWVNDPQTDRIRRESASLALLELGDPNSEQIVREVWQDTKRMEAIDFRVKNSEALGINSGKLSPEDVRRIRDWATKDLGADIAHAFGLLYEQGCAAGMTLLDATARNDGVYGFPAIAAVAELNRVLGGKALERMAGIRDFWKAELEKLRSDPKESASEGGQTFQKVIAKIIDAVTVEMARAGDEAALKEVTAGLAEDNDFARVQTALRLGAQRLDAAMPVLVDIAKGAEKPVASPAERQAALECLRVSGSGAVKEFLEELMTRADARVRFESACRLVEIQIESGLKPVPASGGSQPPK